jgi:uncharacterized membrane protein
MFFHLCQWLFDSALGTSIRESTYVFPLIETLHVLAITLLVGTVAILDLRLWGAVLKGEKVTTVARQLLPLTWAGFALVLSSGVLLFIAEAAKLYSNPAFRLKLLFLVLVGLNPLVFHFTIYRSVDQWDEAVVTPARARLAGAVSLSLWAGIIVAGRAIAYFH